LATELREHTADLARTGDFYAYAVLSLDGDSHKLQYLSAAFNREADLAPEHAGETYYRLSPNEWANYYGVDSYPRSAQIVTARNAEFTELHRKPDTGDCTLDRFQIAHVSRLHRSILAAMKRVRKEGGLGGETSFAILWGAPGSPDDILFCSAKALNSQPLFDAFWAEFGDEFVQMECDRFE
jgi:hypothetical protein